MVFLQLQSVADGAIFKLKLIQLLSWNWYGVTGNSIKKYTPNPISNMARGATFSGPDCYRGILRETSETFSEVK